MSKKHYQQVADILKKVRDMRKDEESLETLNHVAHELCIMFKMDNSNFKGFKFLEACGIKD